MSAQGVGDDEFIGNSFIIKCIMVYLSMYSPSSTDPVPVAEGRFKWMTIVLKDYRKITNLDPNNIRAPDPPFLQDIFELDPYPATTPYDLNDHNSVARWLQIMPLKKVFLKIFVFYIRKHSLEACTNLEWNGPKNLFLRNQFELGIIQLHFKLQIIQLLLLLFNI
jgi:hypothetical protein